MSTFIYNRFTDPKKQLLASDVISHYQSIVKSKGHRVGLLCRVTTVNQGYADHPADIDGFLRTVVYANEGIVAFSHWIVASAKHPELYLPATVELAKACGAIILTESTERYVRNEDFSSQEPQLQAGTRELQVLQKLSRGEVLATYLHPDAPYEEVHNYQCNVRGEWKKGRLRKGERGYLKQRKQDLSPSIVGLYDQGLSLGEIAKLQQTSKSNVQHWIDKSLSERGLLPLH